MAGGSIRQHNSVREEVKGCFAGRFCRGGDSKLCHSLFLLSSLSFSFVRNGPEVPSEARSLQKRKEKE
jgi:hypothetical protein